MFSLSNMPSTTSIFSTYTNFVALAMLVKTVLSEIQNMIRRLIPQELQDKLLSKLGILIGKFSSQMTLVIEEDNGYSPPNQIYEDSEVYLGTKITHSVRSLKVYQAPKEKNFSVTINQGEKIIEMYQGIQLVWEVICTEIGPEKDEQRRSFQLSFDKKHLEMVFGSYLPHVKERSKAIKDEKRRLMLYSLGQPNGKVNLDHPFTFDTLAMDPTLKKELIDDLDRFLKRRDYYKRVGKAWKRGYLLYGPPGTGKSSLIAAMANHLKFDIYDLALTTLRNSSDLRGLLLSTKNRSILVIEDIDCSAELQNRQPEGQNQDDSHLKLSVLLNFADGLWSSCGDERIIVFTTNHKNKLDPALLRPGRMDMHIHMSYCTPSGFKTLASNYLGVENHHRFLDIEKLLTEIDVTPAQIAKELMKSEEADVALEGLIKFLQRKKMAEHSEPNGEREKEVDEEQDESQDIKEEC